MIGVPRALRASTIFVCFMFSGCSVADFKQPISAFSDATKVAATSFDDYANSLDQIAQQQNAADVIARKAQIIPAKNDCERQSKRCRLLIAAGAGTKPLKANILPNTRKIMAGLVTYAGYLTAIATSESGTEIKNAGDAAHGLMAVLMP